MLVGHQRHDVIGDQSVVDVTGASKNVGPCDAGDLGVHGVRRLEHRSRPTRAAVGQQQALEDFVGPVGSEDLHRGYPMGFGQGGP